MIYEGHNEIKRQTITPFKALQITKIGGMTNTNFNALADKLKALHTSKLDFKYHFNLTYEMKKYLELKLKEIYLLYQQRIYLLS